MCDIFQHLNLYELDFVRLKKCIQRKMFLSKLINISFKKMDSFTQNIRFQAISPPENSPRKDPPRYISPRNVPPRKNRMFFWFLAALFRFVARFARVRMGSLVGTRSRQRHISQSQEPSRGNFPGGNIPVTFLSHSGSLTIIQLPRGVSLTGARLSCLSVEPKDLR